jgi:hypothetical protein
MSSFKYEDNVKMSFKSFSVIMRTGEYHGTVKLVDLSRTGKDLTGSIMNGKILDQSLRFSRRTRLATLTA